MKNANIRLVRGTSLTLTVTVTDGDGNPYTMTEQGVVRFGVKQNVTAGEYLVKKEVTVGENGKYSFQLMPEDTEELPFGIYKYDVGLQEGDHYYNVIPCSDLVLCQNVTHKED